MSSNRSSKRWAGRALSAAAALALAVAMTTGTALAAPAGGKVSLSLRSGGETSLLKQRTKFTLPVADLELRAAATVRTTGSVKLHANGRTARLRGLVLQIAGERSAISAKLGKRRLVVFRAEGQPRIDASSLALNGAQLSLTGAAASTLRDRLGLGDLSAGSLGTLAVKANLDAVPAPAPAATQPEAKKSEAPAPEQIVDPYAQQCALQVKSKTAGSAPGPDSTPSLGSPATVSGGEIEWGLSGGLRYYVVEISGGALVPIAPAEVLNPPLPAPQIGAFRFPAGSGEYEVNSTADGSDDQAIVEGEGEVVLCNSPHGFRVTLSNPTVTIDGVDSRLTVDVDTNMSGTWTPAQRVDIATLDLSGADPFYDENAKTVTWADLPTTLTAAGEQALQLCNPNIPGPCDYEEGDPLDPLTVTASTATEEAWPFDSSCSLTSTAAPQEWPSAPPAPVAAPALASPLAVSSGSVNWGFRNGLRSTVQNMGGVFNLSGGAARSDAVNMSGKGKFFTWPGTSGQYEAAASGPGKLVLQATGVVGICQSVHGFGTVLANPTVVIDGASSRLSMDVASRSGLSWTSGRVDVASLAVGSVVVDKQANTPSTGQETITWTFPDPGSNETPGDSDDDEDSSTKSSVKLASGGTSALWLLGNTYRTAGLSLNKLAVTVVVPSS